jgi:dihydrofolate synthase/folylpolyglutamate synthase
MYARGIARIKRIAEAMEDDGLPVPTVFEMETALAFWYFAQEACDIVVLEAGLGGTLDATNVVTNTVCAVITAISMDHQNILGNSLADIAAHKAGIIKHMVPTVLLGQSKEVEAVIRSRCDEVSAPLTRVNPEDARIVCATLRGMALIYKGYEAIKCKQLGICQKDNVAVAIEVTEILRQCGYMMSDEQMFAGIAKTVWRGRFEIIEQEPLVIIDGAHNPEGAKTLKESLDFYLTNRKYVYVMGVLADKDYTQIIEVMAPRGKAFFTVTPDNPRALPAKQLKEAILKQEPLLKVYAETDVNRALAKAKKLVQRDEAIVVFGSLFVLKEINRIN